MDEPAAIKYPEDWAIFEASLAPLIKARDTFTKSGRKLELALYVYFHDCAPFYEKLVALPVDIVGLDFTYYPKLVDMIAAKGSPKTLGLADSWTAAIRDWKILRRSRARIERILPKIKGERAFLGDFLGSRIPSTRSRFCQT